MKKWRFITTACRQVPETVIRRASSGARTSPKAAVGHTVVLNSTLVPGPVLSLAVLSPALLLPAERPALTICLLRPLPLLPPRPRLLLPDQLCCIVLTAKRPLLLLRPLLFPLLLLLSVLSAVLQRTGGEAFAQPTPICSNPY